MSKYTSGPGARQTALGGRGAAEVPGAAKPGDDGLTTVALTVTCGGTKVLGMPKAVVRA